MKNIITHISKIAAVVAVVVVAVANTGGYVMLKNIES